MRKILIFIGLKIAEIGGVCGIVAIVYGIGLFAIYLGVQVGSDLPLRWLAIWLMGFVFFMLIFGCLAGIFFAIKANWDWAGRIARKK